MTETPAASTGWVLAPCEPTREMYKAGVESLERGMGDAADADAGLCYRAMLAAAPARVLSDEDVERAARARYEASHEGSLGPTPFNNWATWEAACEMPGWKEREVSNLRAALAALSVDETIEGE